MKKLFWFLIPIAASNLFGFTRFLLLQSGLALEVDRFWRLFPVALAILLVIIIVKTKNPISVYLGVIVLGLGSIASLGGIWLGLQFGSNIAIGMSIFWLGVFSFGAYKLPSNYSAQPNA